MTSTIAIPVALLVITTLMLWFVFYTKGLWITKAIITPTVLFFTVVVWLSMGGLLGWATPEELPEKYQLHWILVQEPIDGDEGGIYLLVNDISIIEHSDVRIGGYTSNTKQPRLYKMPYTREGHKQAERFQKMLKQGKSLFISRTKGEGDGDGDGEGNGKGSKGRGTARQGTGPGGEGGNQEAPFGYLMPPFKLPAKS